MPSVISVSDFIRETREDINSPTTSGFVNRIPQCKETVIKLEEVRQLFLHLVIGQIVRTKYNSHFQYVSSIYGKEGFQANFAIQKQNLHLARERKVRCVE